MLLQRTLRRTMASSASSRLFLGLDSSTQGLKATAVDDSLKVVHTFAVNYQRDLGAAYGLTNGTIAKPGNVVVQPTLMVRGGGALRECATLRAECRR